MTAAVILLLSLASATSNPDRPARVVIGRLVGPHDFGPFEPLIVFPDGAPRDRSYPRAIGTPILSGLDGRDPEPAGLTDGTRVRLSLDRHGFVRSVEVLPWWMGDPDLTAAVTLESWVAELGDRCPTRLRATLAPLGSRSYAERERGTRAFSDRLAAGDVDVARALVWGRLHRDREVRRRCELMFVAGVPHPTTDYSLKDNLQKPLNLQN